MSLSTRKSKDGFSLPGSVVAMVLTTQVWYLHLQYLTVLNHVKQQNIFPNSPSILLSLCLVVSLTFALHVPLCLYKFLFLYM